MKKTLALILMLVMVAFAFASCEKDKKNGDATTAKPATTAEPATTAAPATTTAEPEDTEAPHVHVIPDEWDDEYLAEPDCTNEGMRVKYCPECGAVVATESVPANPNAHKVASWTVTEAVNMFHTTGSRNGVCTVCGNTIVEEIKFQPTIEAFTASSGQYNTEKVYYADVRGENHFYPTETNPEGNDLLVEFSILWNETLLNLDASSDCYMCGRFEGGKPLYYFSPVAGCPTSDAGVAGAFEWMGNFKTPISDAEVTTPVTMMSPSSNYADYPNIMGADPDHPEYGWHRIQVRIHLALINEAALKEKAAGTKAKKEDYIATATVYVDGVAAFKLSTGTTGMDKIECNLFTAEADGNGGIKYEDGDAYVVAFYLNRTKAVSGKTAYVVISDINVTCGKDFAMPVEKVATPAAATYEPAEGVEIDAPVYFKLAD